MEPHAGSSTVFWVVEFVYHGRVVTSWRLGSNRHDISCLTSQTLLARSGNVCVEAVHLMALHEAPLAGGGCEALPNQDARVRYGFAFLDAAAGRFYVGAADDDAGRSTLGALLTQVRADCIYPDRSEGLKQ